MSCKDCLNRREFLAKSALAAAALAACVPLQGCGDGEIGFVRPNSGGGDPNLPAGGPITIKVTDFPGLATTNNLVDIGNDRAVMRTGASTFIALSRICTHQQCDTDVRNNRFECPCHGSIFSNTGDVIRGPSTGESITPLRKLTVRFDAASNSLTIS